MEVKLSPAIACQIRTTRAAMKAAHKQITAATDPTGKHDDKALWAAVIDLEDAMASLSKLVT